MLVAERSHPADGDHLSFQAARQDVLDVVPDHVPGLGLDELFRLENVAPGGVLALDGLQFVFAAVLEPIEWPPRTMRPSPAASRKSATQAT
jgi:hypothetical protein